MKTLQQLKNEFNEEFEQILQNDSMITGLNQTNQAIAADENILNLIQQQQDMQVTLLNVAELNMPKMAEKIKYELMEIDKKLLTNELLIKKDRYTYEKTQLNELIVIKSRQIEVKK